MSPVNNILSQVATFAAWRRKRPASVLTRRMQPVFAIAEFWLCLSPHHELTNALIYKTKFTKPRVRLFPFRFAGGIVRLGALTAESQ